MFKKMGSRRLLLAGILGFVLTGIMIAALLLPQISSAASPKRQVETAWINLQASGKYSFSTVVEQTTHPAPALTNVGKSSERQVYAMDGATDLVNNQIFMRLYQQDNNVTRRQDAIEIRVESGQAYGRTEQSEWVSLDSFSTDSFAPGNDFSSFLKAADNIRWINTESREVPGVDGVIAKVEVGHYRFDIDSNRFAAFMRDQMAAEYQRAGKLPHNMQLSISEMYRNMRANGEIWIGADGYPLRMQVQMQMPQEKSGERVEALIKTDFRDISAERKVAGLPLATLAGSLGLLKSGAEWQNILIGSAGSVLFVCLAALLLLKSGRKSVQIGISILMIALFVFTPLWESHQNVVFARELEQKQTAQNQAQVEKDAEKEARATLYESDWDPSQDPRAGLSAASASAEVAQLIAHTKGWFSSSLAGSLRQLADEVGEAGDVDSDLDGLTDAYESGFDITILDPNNYDTDGDGLSDGEEIKLGTSPGEVDSDHDGISDFDEINAFYYRNASTPEEYSGDWYSHAMDRDTDHDNLLDGVECDARVLDDDTTTAGVCRDTDGDGIPDIFDTDDDNDGVPTLVDLDPISGPQTIFSGSSPFKMSIRGVEPGLPVFVDFQLRPTNAKHLTYILNVLDWPKKDTDGQIQRRSSDSTYGDQLTSAQLTADPRPANGDMRLVPMLEILIKDSVPLVFTNQFSSTISDANLSGTLTFTHPVPNSGIPSQVKLTEAPSADYRLYYGSGNCDRYSGETYLGQIHNDHSLNMNIHLGNIAASQYVFLIKNLTEDKVLACSVPSHPHANQVDQVIDTSMVDAYGGFVRDDTNGNVLTYMPLNMVTDVSGNEPVAFSGQLPVQNLEGRLNSSNMEVRMVWLINMLTDVCKPMPESYVDSTTTPWCDADKPERWYTDVPRVVHSYDDSFRMTGMQVVEDHGTRMAVVFEDPQYDLEPAFDDPLWKLSSGLQGSFLAGRDDFDLDEIAQRFDREDGVYSTGAEQLWGIEAGLLQVMTYEYDYFDESYKFSTQQAQQLFAQYFPTAVTDGGYTTANLLFARQYDQRSMGMGEATVSSGLTTFNLGAVALVTNAMVNWAPYQYVQDSWKSTPLEQYLDLLESRLRSLEDFQASSDDVVERDIIDGQIYMLRYYYQALFLGILGLTGVNGTPQVSPNALPDFNYYSDFLSLQRKGAALSKIVKTIAEVVLNGLDRCTIAWLNFYAGDKISKVEGFFQALGDGLKQKAAPITKHLTSLFKKVAFGILVVVVVVAVITCAVIALAEPESAAGKIMMKILMIGMNVLTIVLSIMAIKGAIELLRASKAITSAAQKATIIGAVIAGIITWGVFIYTWASSGMSFGSLAFNTALAEAIAATMLIILMAALACTGVGAIIVGIVAIIDAIISSFCYAFGVYDREGEDTVKDYVCIGISGWVTKIFAWFIYSNTYLVDYDNSDRIEFTNVATDYQDDRLGITSANKLKVNMGIRNTITLSDVPFDWKAAAYFWQYSNANAKTSTFDYKLNPSEEDIHDSLSRGSMKNLWQSAGTDKWTYEFSAGTSGYSIPLPAAGINQDPTVYLAEGSALPVQECWVIPPIFPFIPFPIPVCYIRTEKATFNVSVGESLTLDVFPDTLDDFYSLKAKGNGTFALSWDSDFPALRDADGDKLIYSNDPDDSSFDTDNDGLSDYSETVFGTDPRLFDTDQDGLYDLAELLIQTDPTRKDTDGDGLTDFEEVQGWFYTYGFYADGSPKETMVYPNPLAADSDLDGISDLEERIYGFNPQVPEEANILDYSLSYREMDAPIVALSLDERGGTTLFADDSSFGFDAFCQEDHCPQSGFTGRYLNSVYFGGDDFLYLPTSSKQISFLNNQHFTLAAWVYPSGDGTLISKWQQGAGNIQEFTLSLSGMHPQLTSADRSVSSTAQLAADRWSHLAVSFDGTQARFYIDGYLADGCQEGSCAWQNTTVFASDTLAPPLTLGAGLVESGGPLNPFTGYLDEVQIFDHILGDVSLDEAGFISSRLMAHRYNYQDTFIRPAETVEYTSVVTNLLNSRFAYGLLHTVVAGYQAIMDWASKLLPRTFVLYPDNPVVTGVNTLTKVETLQIDPNWNVSQPLTLEQVASAQIVDRRTESNFAQLWLKFNETSGAVKFTDASGNMPLRDATCSSCPTAGVSGMLNNAVRFNQGQDTPLALPTLSSLNVLQRGITVAFWIKPDASSTSNLTILKTAANRFSISLVPTGSNYRPQVYMNGSSLALSTSRNITGGAWNHVVVQYNDGSQVLAVFVNGSRVAQATGVAALSTDDTLVAGGSPQGRNYILDDLRIFNRPLTILDINRLAERPVLDMQMETSSFGDSSEYHQSISVPVNAPTLSSSSIRGSSLYPNTSTSTGFVQVNGNSLLDMHDGAFTFSVWIYPQADTSGNWQGIFGKHERNDPNYTYPTLERNGAYLRFGYGTGSAELWKQSGAILSNNSWYHITVTLNSNGAGGYEYRLYRDSDLVDSYIFTAPPASRSTFFVGHSSSVYYTYLGTLYMDNEHDAGSAAEPYIYENRNGSYYHSVMGETDMEDGDSKYVNHGDTITDYSSVRYVVMEEDSTSADDYCGDVKFYWNTWPGTGTASLSDGFDGRLTYELHRPSVQFIGKIDEFQVFRYAIDGEMVYDQTNAIPITARLPLDERPAADTFENKAFLGTLDDGICTGENCPAAGTIGLIDQAVRFDGQDDVITVPVATTQDYMVSLWVNTLCPNCGLYSLRHNGGTVLNQIYLRGGNVCSKVNQTEVCSRNAVLTDGQWHHVVYSNNNGTTRLWLDGVVVNQLSGQSMQASGLGIASLGMAAEASRDYLSGQLDDVRVFRYSQDVKVIAELLNRAPLFLAHLDEKESVSGFEDATPYDWMLDCSGDRCPQPDQAGRLGRAVSFDGTNDMLSLRQTQLSPTATGFSISVWVKPTDTLEHPQSLWSLWNLNNSQIKYNIAIAPNSMNLCVRNGTSAAGCPPDSNVGLVMNVWNQVTLVVRRSSTADSYQLYINGYLDSSGAGLTGSNLVNGLGRLQLGNSSASTLTNGGFAGLLDEVAVFAYELNEIDVRESFHYQMEHVEERQSISMQIDAENPSVELISFDPDFPYVSELDRILHVEATDLTAGISALEMTVSHVNMDAPLSYLAPLCMDSASGTSFCPSFDPQVGDGTYSLIYRAIDAVGNQTISQPYHLLVDNSSPRLTANLVEGQVVPAVKDDQLENNWRLDLYGSVQDEILSNNLPGSGLNLNSVAISVYNQYGALIGSGKQQPVLTKVTNGYNWSLEFFFPESEPTGKLTLVVEADDTVGNHGEININFLFDATAPQSSLNESSMPITDVIQTLDGSKAVDQFALRQVMIGGSASDIPGLNLMYMTEEGIDAETNVNQVQVAINSALNASYLFNEPYPHDLLIWLPLDKEEIPAGTEGIPDVDAPVRYYLDSSPFQIAGECQTADCPMEGPFGHKNGSFYFNGDNKYINLGTQVNLANRSFTISVWANREAANRNDPILWQGPLAMASQRLLLGFNANNQMVCGFGGRDLVSTQIFDQPGWHNWGCSYDLATQVRTLWLDGQALVSDTISPLMVMDENLYVGLAPVGSFKGDLDELVVYSRPLSAEEMREQYSAYQYVYRLSVDDDFLVNGDWLEERSGFYQLSQLITASGDLHNKVSAGIVGDYALTFHGTEKLVVKDHFSLNLDRSQFSQLAWVDVDALTSEAGIFSQFDENPEMRYPSLLLLPDGSLQAGFGNGYNWFSVRTAAAAFTFGRAHLVAATFDGQTYRIYVDGVQVLSDESLAGITPYSNQSFAVGERLNGTLDEVALFTRALSAEEIFAFYQMSWKPTHLENSGKRVTWNATVPYGLEGSFDVNLRAWDGGGQYMANQKQMTQWGGTVDSYPPRLSIIRTEIDPDDDTIVAYDFVIEDTMLDITSIHQNICESVTYQLEYFNSSWLLAGGIAPNTAIYRVNGHCEGVKPLYEQAGMSACDSAGNCSAEWYEPMYPFRIYLPLINGGNANPVPDSAAETARLEKILETANDWPLLDDTQEKTGTSALMSAWLAHDVLTYTDQRSIMHLNLQGFVSAPQAVRSLEIKIWDGSTLLGITQAALVDNLWNAPWIFAPASPPPDGSYRLELLITDTSGSTTTINLPVELDLRP